MASGKISLNAGAGNPASDFPCAHSAIPLLIDFYRFADKAFASKLSSLCSNSTGMPYICVPLKLMGVAQLPSRVLVGQFLMKRAVYSLLGPISCALYHWHFSLPYSSGFIQANQ